MNNDKLVDFLFTGTAVVPATLFVADQAGMALMIFLPLMIGACLTSTHLERALNTRASLQRASTRN